MSSILATSFLSCLGAGTLWSEEQCQHFLPTCSAGVGDAGTDPLSATAHSWAVANNPRMVTRDTSPVRICRGYRSAPPDLGRQAHMATPKASAKAW